MKIYIHHLYPFICLWTLRLLRYHSVQFSSVQSLSRVRLFATHELQHARPACPSPAPGVHSDSGPSSRWCHPTISSSVFPFSSCPQSLPASESFPMSQLFVTLQIETACFKTWRVMKSPLKNVLFSLERNLSIWNLLFQLLLLFTLAPCKSLYCH